MTERLIDLRSDTVTRPTERMRRAMAEAPVGDDVFGEDPTVNRLQERAAEMFGREAGLFVPSGTMGNLICLQGHARPGDEAIVEARSHIYNYEMGGLSAVAGILPRVVEGRGGLLDVDSVRQAIHLGYGYRSRTALLCLENTHNMAGGTVYSLDQTARLCRFAREQGIRVHLDGARIFNAAVALGCTVAELTREFDSLSFCFSKGLGAPVGSMILGNAEFIAQARRTRKILGGGMRQAGILAAAALLALEESPARLHEDHANAARLARAIASMPHVEIDPDSVQTNILIFDIAGTGMNSLQFLKALRAEGVLAVPVGSSQVRMVAHADVDAADIEAAIAGLGNLLARLSPSA